MGINLKDFIKKYRAEINNRKFEEIYSLANEKLNVLDIGELTELFYKCGVDPLKYMNRVPKSYVLNSSLKTINIPSNIVSLGSGAFGLCISLTNVIIPDSVAIIEAGAFSRCISLTSVTIPDRVTSIEECVFWGCTSLMSVTIPDGVKSIGERAFDGCTSLKSINYNGSKNQWDMIDLYPDWKDGSSLETIHCLDGDINL